MEIEFSLSRADYIDFQLFAATKSETTRKNRKKGRNRLPIIYLILGTILLTHPDKAYAIIFYVIGVLWYLLFPVFAKKRYARHYEKYVDENFKNRFDTNIKVKFADDHETIEATDFEGESKFKTSEIERIIEIKRFIYIKMNSGSHLILPKYKIDDVDKLKDELEKISKSKSFNIETEFDLDFRIVD